MKAREFDTLMAAVRQPAVLADDGGRVLAANPAARLTFGDMPAGTLLTLKFRTPEMRAAIDTALVERRAAQCDYHVRVPDERWFRVEAAPVNGQSPCCLLLFQDVSEAHKIDLMRADFVANASHELRTPLAALTGFIETLRGPARNDPKAQDRFLAIMQDQAGRMSRLIDDLLSLSRLEMRPFARLTQDVDLVALVRETAAGIAPVAEEAKVVIAIRAPANPVVVPGIRDELRQAIENLIENACKYGRAGGRVDIAVETDEATGDALVSVKDLGPGIAPEHLPRLTERFYRAEPSGQPVKGTGLGLAIVKHIVSRHRGQLSIHSAPGAGATFTIRLPRAGNPQT